MFLDRESLIDSLQGLVGFDQSVNPEYATIIPSLVASRSGKIVNREHPLLTIENIDQSIVNFSQFTYTAYNVATEYAAGDKVSIGGVNYEYTNASPSTGNTPPNTSFWREIDELSDYLIKIERQGISEAIDAILDYKKVRQRIKSIYENVFLYDGIANYRDTVPNRDDFVGLRLRLKKDRSLITVLNRISTQFSTIATGDLTISLYHSSQSARIATITVTPGNRNSSKWTVVPDDAKVIRYLSDNYDAGGDFYLGYKQSDLEALGTEALRMDPKTLLSCTTCGGMTRTYYQNYSEYVDVQAFRIPESEFAPNDELFDPGKIQYVINSNYGINLDMDARCDIGPFFKKQEDHLAQLINLMTAKILMRGIAFNQRHGNSLANPLREQAKKELYSFPDARGTLEDRVGRAVKSTSFDFSALNDDCLPTENMSISIGSDEFEFRT